MVDMPDFSKKKIIIADVDETICETCTPMSMAMSAKINSLMEKGLIFVFISGTKTKYLLDIVSTFLRNKHYLLPTTGTRCIEVEEDGSHREIYVQNFSEEERRDIINGFEKVVENYGVVSLTTKEDQIQDRGTQITLSAIGRAAPIELKKKYDPQGIIREEWVRFLKSIVDENKYEINIAGTTSIDVTAKGVNKGKGILDFCKNYGFSVSDILFIGDKTEKGGNDYAATKVVDYIRVTSLEDTLQKLKRLFP